MSKFVDLYLIGELVDSHGNVHYEDLLNLPTVDVVEVAYGEWKQHNQGEFAPTYYCSNCEELAEINLYGEYVFSQYCPHCGAKMSESLKVHEIGKSLVDGIQAGIKGEKDGKIY